MCAYRKVIKPKCENHIIMHSLNLYTCIYQASHKKKINSKGDAVVKKNICGLKTASKIFKSSVVPIHHVHFNDFPVHCNAKFDP